MDSGADSLSQRAGAAGLTLAYGLGNEPAGGTSTSRPVVVAFDLDNTDQGRCFDGTDRGLSLG